MKFGNGVIKDLEEKNNDLFVTIQFDNGEIKTLSAMFAKLKVIK